MASATQHRLPPKRTKEQFEIEKAVITGLYAAVGMSILFAENSQYAQALKNIKRVARDQSDEMTRRSAS